MAVTKKLKDALDNVESTYNELVQIATSIVEKSTGEVDVIIRQVGNVKDLSDSQIRNLIILLSIKSYSFSESKEQAALKSECAEALRKEAHAKIYHEVEGTHGSKENTAISETAAETLTESIYNLVASLLKTKLDEIHRIVDALKSVLLSRMQEAKLLSFNSNKAAFES